MTIETASGEDARHGGQIEREIMWLIQTHERLVTCAGAAINAWVEGEIQTPFDPAMAALARLLIEMEDTK